MQAVSCEGMISFSLYNDTKCMLVYGLLLCRTCFFFTVKKKKAVVQKKKKRESAEYTEVALNCVFISSLFSHATAFSFFVMNQVGQKMLY